MSLHHLAVMTQPSLSRLLYFLCILAIPIFPFLKFEIPCILLLYCVAVLVGAVVIYDKLKPEAQKTVECLQSMNVRVALLTGDNHRTALAIAEAVSVLIWEMFAHVCISSYNVYTSCAGGNTGGRRLC